MDKKFQELVDKNDQLNKYLNKEKWSRKKENTQNLKSISTLQETIDK